MLLLLCLVAGTSLNRVLARPACGQPRPRGEALFRDPTPTVKRQTEASWANLTGSSAECAWYNYPPVNAVINNYPTAYGIAYILPNDTYAWSIFEQVNTTVNSKLPNDLPRGTAAGVFTGVNYLSSDPDCWWTFGGCTSPAAFTGLSADITTVPEPNTWGYTFDDGPLCSHNEFYDFLESNNQKATMFYIGSNVASYPLQALRGLDDGHQICVHTWSHHYMTALTNEQAFAELYYGRQIIKDILGVTPKCWRPPFGDVDNRIRAIAAGLNLTTIVWSEDTADWILNVQTVPPATEAQVDSNYESFINMSQHDHWATYGPIILSHELDANTVGEAMKYYPQMKAAFSHLVPIATAYNETQPYVENTILYPTFAEYISGETSQSIVNASHVEQVPLSSASAAATSTAKTTVNDGSATPAVAVGSESGGLSASPSPSKATSAGIKRDGMATVIAVAYACCLLGIIVPPYLLV